MPSNFRIERHLRGWRLVGPGGRRWPVDLPELTEQERADALLEIVEAAYEAGLTYRDELES